MPRARGEGCAAQTLLPTRREGDERLLCRTPVRNARAACLEQPWRAPPGLPRAFRAVQPGRTFRAWGLGRCAVTLRLPLTAAADRRCCLPLAPDNSCQPPRAATFGTNH